MIIEKLSPYLTLTNQHHAHIAKIQDSVCNALSHFFIDKDSEKWNDFLEGVSTWNGRESTLSINLQEHFEELHGYIDRY